MVTVELPMSTRTRTRPTIREAQPAEIDRAIARTVAYADVFDFPLTPGEVHRYLIGTRATRESVDTRLDESDELATRISHRDGFVTLAGREGLIARRQVRAEVSARLWRSALRNGRLLASLPFVHMLAVTGDLAMDNAAPGADIDYLIVTASGRVWLCRAFAIGLVRAVKLRGEVVCPNYLLSEHSLVVREQNLYTAHELAQMVPLAGHWTYHGMRRENVWADEFLPNASGPPRDLRVTPLARPARAAAEGALRSSPGAWLERWERQRKIRKLTRTHGDAPHAEVAFSSDWCKGHFDGHGGRTLAAYEDRLRALEGIRS